MGENPNFRKSGCFCAFVTLSNFRIIPLEIYNLRHLHIYALQHTTLSGFKHEAIAAVKFLITIYPVIFTSFFFKIITIIILALYQQKTEPGTYYI